MVRVKIISRIFLRDLKQGFASFGESIVTFINTVLLVIVYVFGVGVSALMMARKRKTLLDMKIDGSVETYWKTTPLAKDMKSHYRQF